MPKDIKQQEKEELQSQTSSSNIYLHDLRKAFYGGTGTVRDNIRAWLKSQTGLTSNYFSDLWRAYAGTGEQNLSSFPSLTTFSKGINLYHEGMGYITRSQAQIDADLDEIVLNGGTHVRVVANPMKAYTQAELVIQRAKVKGLTVLAGANFTDGRAEINYDTGTATSGSTSTITDTSKSWTTNEWAGFQVYIVGGTNNGQSCWIASNTANTLTVTAVEGFNLFSSPIDATSQYEIDFQLLAENVWNYPTTGYADKVETMAQDFYDAGADYFDVGNEISNKDNDQEAFFNDTNLPTNIKALCTSVASNTSWTIDKLGYCAGFWKVGAWKNAGIGTMGHIGFNFYQDEVSFMFDVADAVGEFGADKVWATEWSTETTFGGLSVTEGEWSSMLNLRASWLKDKGVLPFYFAYRETTDNGFGLKKTVATGGEHEAWDAMFGITPASITDYGLYFGSDRKVTVTDSADFDTGSDQLTIECFVNVYDPNHTYYSEIVKKDGQWILRLEGDKLQGIVWTSGDANAKDSTAIPTDQWVHVAVCYDGANIDLYVDGSRVAQTAQTGNIAESANDITFGWASGESFGGAISNLRISSVARYSGTTYTVPTAQLTSDANTLGLWLMDEGTGTTATDSSSNSNNGTLDATNTPVWIPGPFA